MCVCGQNFYRLCLNFKLNGQLMRMPHKTFSITYTRNVTPSFIRYVPSGMNVCDRTKKNNVVTMCQLHVYVILVVLFTLYMVIKYIHYCRVVVWVVEWVSEHYIFAYFAC